MLKKNQQRLKEKRRAKRIAEARAQKKKEQKPQSQQSRATEVAFSRGNNFGAMLRDKPTHRKPPTNPPPVPQGNGGNGQKKPPATMPSNPPPLNRPGGSGTHGRPMSSNPQFGSQPPKRENYKTREAYMKALARYTELKNRAKRTAAGSRSSSSGPNALQQVGQQLLRSFDKPKK